MAKTKYAPSLFGDEEKPSSKLKLSESNKLSTVPAQNKDAVAAHFKEIELSPYIPPKKKVVEEPKKQEVKKVERVSDFNSMVYRTSISELPPIDTEEQKEFIRNHKTLKQLKQRKKK